MLLHWNMRCAFWTLVFFLFGKAALCYHGVLSPFHSAFMAETFRGRTFRERLKIGDARHIRWAHRDAKRHPAFMIRSSDEDSHEEGIPGAEDEAGPGSSNDGGEDVTPPAMDVRAFRAKLMSSGLDGWGRDEEISTQKRWAHALARPELGCLVVAKEDQFTKTQQHFNRAVILIIEQGEAGTAGLILNRPTTFTMGDVCKGNLQRVPGMESNVLYMGGDVMGMRPDGLDVVNLMHGRQDIPGAEVVKGIRLGGLKEALEMVNDGRATPNEFKFFSRYTGWRPGQLKAEVRSGLWYLAACDVETILSDHNHPDQPAHLWEDILSRLSSQSG